MHVWSYALPEGLDQQDFQDTVIDLLGRVDFDWIVEVETDSGWRPVGVITADIRAKGRGIEPHVDWFPWATARNIFECTGQFLMEMGKDSKVLLFVPMKDLPFWQRLWQYRVIKKGCKIPDYYEPGEEVMMFYTAGPF